MASPGAAIANPQTYGGLGICQALLSNQDNSNKLRVIMEYEELMQAEEEAYDLIWALMDTDADTDVIKQAMRDWAALDAELKGDSDA